MSGDIAANAIEVINLSSSEMPETTLLIFPPWLDHLSEYPPLGICQLGAVLEQEGLPVSLLDLGLWKEEEWKARLIPKMNEVKPTLVGISAQTSMIMMGLKIAEFIKTTHPEIKILLGGPHPTARPNEALKKSFVDYVIRGEGEIPLLELALKKDITAIKGLSYKKDGKIIHNPLPPLIDNLNELPLPARHLLDLKQYAWFPEISLMSSRGCPFPCYYCFGKVFGKKFRGRSAEQVVKEMEYLNKKYGYTKFYFYDDVFTLNKNRVLEFCNLLFERGHKFEWRCLSRIDTLDDGNFERLKMMRKAGCIKIQFGIETGDPDLMKKIKSITQEQARRVVQAAKDAGIETKCYFMIGHPWDTKESVMNTIRFAKEVGSDLSLFSIVTPFPETKLWEMAKEMGIIIEEEDRDWSTFYVNSENMDDHIMRTYTLSTRDLIRFYKKGWRELYLKTMVDMFKNPAKLLKIIKTRGIITVARSFYRKIIVP